MTRICGSGGQDTKMPGGQLTTDSMTPEQIEARINQLAKQVKGYSLEDISSDKERFHLTMDMKREGYALFDGLDGLLDQLVAFDEMTASGMCSSESDKLYQAREKERAVLEEKHRVLNKKLCQTLKLLLKKKRSHANKLDELKVQGIDQNSTDLKPTMALDGIGTIDKVSFSNLSIARVHTSLLLTFHRLLF